MHVQVDPTIGIPNTVAAFNNLAKYLRDKSAGAPDPLDIGCVAKSGGVALAGVAELAEAHPVLGSAPKTSVGPDPLAQAQALEDAAKSLKSGAKGVGAFSWKTLLEIILAVLQAIGPLLP